MKSRRFEISRLGILLEGVTVFGEESDVRAASLEEHLVVRLHQHPGEAGRSNDEAETRSGFGTQKTIERELKLNLCLRKF